MRLIDADALNEALGVGKECADCQYSVGGGFCIGGDLGFACEAIADAPTVEPQRMKGRWMHDGYDHPHGVDWMHCSVCGRREPHVPAAMTNYCPGCGADMRGEQG